jgi:hypothetical protein
VTISNGTVAAAEFHAGRGILRSGRPVLAGRRGGG